MPLSAGHRLGHYEIVEPIGEGGMGAVYRAHDPRLRRDVAIKISASQFSERFEREAQAIAALNHPHICTLHDIGPNYLVMELVEGTPLKGPLELDQALKYAVQICDALDAAHKKSITHRDLKPANILVTASGVKLLDFGLAKITDPTNPTDATQTLALTEVGSVMGTAAYMSPEQAKGEEVDGRSDIFSFGAVLYEMLSGLRAFGRSTTVETLSAVLRDEPLPFDAPADLSTIIARCLRKSAAERFQTIGQVRTALEQADRKPAEKAPSIAVLPFANMSRDLDDEYFSDGLAEEIINLLANIPGLKVIARTSAFAFKGKNEDIRRIAETLGVANVLEGSVRRAGSKLRITAQLIHAIDGTHLWSQRYDRDMTDIFELQDEMSTAIAEQLKVRLIPAKHATTNVAAYEAYLEGRHHAQKFAPDALAKALACFERAVALDPNYAPVHVGMAEYYLIHSNLGFQRPLEVLPKLEAAAQRALALDPSLADAHSLLACARMFLDYNWDEAERLCKRGLALNPTSISTTGAYATFYLRAQGHPELALPALDRTLELDPLATLPHWSKGQSLFCCRRYPEAEREFRRVLEIDPHQAGARWDLGPTLAMQQRFTEAVAEAEEFAQRFGRRSMPLRTLAVVHALAGQTDKARSELAELHACERKGYVPATYFAEIYTLLQELDAAFTWINRAIDQRDPHLLMWIRFQPFDLLRGDPRYLSLLQRMKLA